MTTNMSLESRLRSHFAGDRFQPRHEWERTVLHRARLSTRPTLGFRRGRVLFAAAALGLAALVVVITALPVAAGPDVPSWALGLRSIVGVDSSAGGRATSWGSTIELVGVYLDDQRTVVVLKGNRRPATAIPNAYLVEAGQRYDMHQVVTNDDGYYAVKFGPLRPAPSSRVPVTLHLADGPALPPHYWTLSFSIGHQPAATAGLPSPGRAGSMAVTFAGVNVVPGALALQWSEIGVTYDEVLGPVRTSVDPAKHIQMTERGPVTVHVQAFDSTGKPLPWLDTQIVPAADGSGSVHFSEVFLRTSPAPYRIVITAPSGLTLQRTVGM